MASLKNLVKSTSASFRHLLVYCIYWLSQPLFFYYGVTISMLWYNFWQITKWFDQWVLEPLLFSKVSEPVLVLLDALLKLWRHEGFRGLYKVSVWFSVKNCCTVLYCLMGAAWPSGQSAALEMRGCWFWFHSDLQPLLFLVVWSSLIDLTCK